MITGFHLPLGGTNDLHIFPNVYHVADAPHIKMNLRVNQVGFVPERITLTAMPCCCHLSE